VKCWSGVHCPTSTVLAMARALRLSTIAMWSITRLSKALCRNCRFTTRWSGHRRPGGGTGLRWMYERPFLECRSTSSRGCSSGSTNSIRTRLGELGRFAKPAASPASTWTCNADRWSARHRHPSKRDRGSRITDHGSRITDHGSPRDDARRSVDQSATARRRTTGPGRRLTTGRCCADQAVSVLSCRSRASGSAPGSRPGVGHETAQRRSRSRRLRRRCSR
jgi:hypothetical protein